jgi:cell division septation protein DedD
MRLVLSHSFFVLGVTIVVLSLCGCGSGQNATNGQDISSNDTSQSNSGTGQNNPAVNNKNNSTRRKPLPLGFAVQSDTVDVLQGKKSSVPLSRQQNTKNKPEGKIIYSVQIGAYKSAENASRAELRLKNRFKEPTHSFFDDKLKMVRVFIGIFPSASLAEELLTKMKKDFPKEYSGGFVWKMKK